MSVIEAMARAAMVADERMKREEEYWNYDEVIRAALKAAGALGWKLVPVEPTKEMEAAWARLLYCDWRTGVRAMLAASPSIEENT